MSGRTIHLINGCLLGLLFLGSALVWPDLPSEIPAHFDGGGRVTRWTRTSALSWFAVPLIALALTAVNYFFARLLPRWPHLINLPNKQRFLALPAERRGPVIERIREFLHGISIPLILIMIVVQVSIYRTAVGNPSVGYTIAILLGSLLLTPVILMLWLPRIQSEIDRQAKDPAQR
jgi:uncharacterized membrane protein